MTKLISCKSGDTLRISEEYHIFFTSYFFCLHLQPFGGEIKGVRLLHKGYFFHESASRIKC